MVVYGTMLPTSLGAPQRRSGMRAGAAVAVAAAALVVLVGLGMHSSSSMLLSDNALDLDAVSDTTGRYLSRNAILSSHIPSGGGDSDDEKAVLEAAAGLPQSAHRASARQAFRPNEYVNDYGTGAVSRKKQQLTIKRQQAKLDQLNHGYASQMQKYLTGSKRVGAVETAINSHTANYLENTGRFNKKMRPATEAYILRSAEAQKTKEAKGLVGALSGPMWGSAIPRAVLSEGEARQARFGVVHTPDGFVLRTAATGARKAQTTSLDLIGAKGCECMGNDDEDKGPKCACKGDPTFPSVDNSFSDEEVTEWKQPEVEPTAKEAEDAFAAEQEAKGQEEAAQEAAGAMAAKGRKVQVLKAAAKTVGVKAEQDSINAFLQTSLKAGVEANQDSINAFLQDVLNSAEATKGVAHASLPKLRATVKNLQDVATREPQARVFMAARLNKLSATILAPPAGQQALTDYTNVYIPPDVDDLDNYLQDVLDDVSRTEIPSLDDDEAAATKAPAAMLGAKKPSRVPATQAAATKAPAAMLGAKRASRFPATQDGINAFLQDVLFSAEGQKGVKKASMIGLRQTVSSLQTIAARDVQARDLLAFRLNQLSATLLAPPAGQQALTDYTNVYIPPDVDDLDNYLQGVLDEVSRTEIPSLDDDEAAATKAPAGAGAMLRGTVTGVAPSAGTIQQTLSDMVEAVAKLHPQDKGLAHLVETLHPEDKGLAHLVETVNTVEEVKAVAAKVPASRDLIAERLSKVREITHNAAKKTQTLTDYTNVYIPPDVDDLDNYLQGVLDEVSRTEIPSLDDDAAAKGRVESLMPMDPTRNVWGRSHATNRGKFLDNMEWQHHPFDTAAEEADNLAKATEHQPFDTAAGEADNLAKATEDVVTPMDTAMVHGAPNMRSEKHGADHVRNAYGYQHNDASAEVPVYTIDSPDTAQAAGVLTESSLNKGSKLCETINCDGDGPNGPPADDEPAAPVKAAELGSPAAKMDAMRAFQVMLTLPRET
ncbi:hypothetical protein T484DRAFT_1893504 [Baffinella frigidus]|nr:hypothetical protein T484DRAFT_1893504 [Cryptophyta sp. CCMP2293]